VASPAASIDGNGAMTDAFQHGDGAITAECPVVTLRRSTDSFAPDAAAFPPNDGKPLSGRLLSLAGPPYFHTSIPSWASLVFWGPPGGRADWVPMLPGVLWEHQSARDGVWGTQSSAQTSASAPRSLARRFSGIFEMLLRKLLPCDGR